MFQATGYRAQNIQLRPADRLVLVNDGVLEAGAPGSEFDEQRLAGLLLATAGLTPHQGCRVVVHARGVGLQRPQYFGHTLRGRAGRLSVHFLIATQIGGVARGAGLDPTDQTI